MRWAMGRRRRNTKNCKLGGSGSLGNFQSSKGQCGEGADAQIVRLRETVIGRFDTAAERENKGAITWPRLSNLGAPTPLLAAVMGRFRRACAWQVFLCALTDR